MNADVRSSRKIYLFTIVICLVVVAYKKNKNMHIFVDPCYSF